jgi:hypothetical protein
LASTTAPTGAAAAEPGTRRDTHARLGVLAVLLGAPFVAFPADFVSKALLDGGDDLLANIPELVYSGKKLFEGEVLWTPELWMGHPLLAEPEFATFYLPKLMLLLGQPFVAYAAYLVLHYVAAEMGAYLYLKSLGIGRLGAVFGALAFAYAGFMLGHRAHTMYVVAGAWTPFVLLAFDRAAARGGVRHHVTAALAFAMVPFAGAVQLTVYLAALLVLLAAARARFERDAGRLWALLLCLGPALLVPAAQILPSHDFAKQLATSLRDDYALDVALSFHPLLVPTLAWPIPPNEGEIYSRAGMVVACAAFAALLRVRSAPPAIRAWAVVLGVSFALMLGGYLPPLAHLLHGLPVVGVLRGPARHNFELGLALAVLGAYGVDAARKGDAGRVSRWLLGGAAFSVASVAVIRLAQSGHVSDKAATSLLSSGSHVTAVFAACAFAAWVVALRFREGVLGRVLWAAVGIAPLLETAWVMRVEFWPNRSALGLLEVARAALPEPPRFVRLLSVSLHRGSVDDLAGNSVLFHPGVGSLQGYSSIAYTGASEVLELDMYGQPRNYHELAYSTLPSVFGVTHLVLPSTACSGERVELARPEEPCARARARDAPELSVAAGQIDCAAVSADETFRYSLRITARAAAKEDLGATFAYEAGPGVAWQRRFGIDLPGSALGPAPFTGAAAVRLVDAESWGGLMLENLRASRLEFRDGALRVETERTVAALAALDDAPRSSEHVTIAKGALRLEPKEGVAWTERAVRSPRSERPEGGRAVLEVDARAAGPHPADLVVDLHALPSMDPDDAELVVHGASLGPAWTTAREEIRLGDLPDEFALRVRAAGGDAVELRRARLSIPKDANVYDYPVAVHRYRRGVTVENGAVTLDPHTVFGGAMHLPVSAFDVVLDAEAEGGGAGPVYYGLETPTRFELPRGWKLDEPFTRRTRVHHVAVLPPDADAPTLFVRAAGASKLRVHELSATDVCALRGYTSPKRLANGLFLFENPGAAPRAYAVGAVTRVTDLRAARAALLDLKPAEIGRSAVVTDNVPSNLREGVVLAARFGQRTADIDVRADVGPTLLVVNDRFDPGIEATIDGAPAPIVPVNALVRGVVVPLGRHRVRMTYRAPPAVWIGALLSLAGIAAACATGHFTQRARKAQKRV